MLPKSETNNDQKIVFSHLEETKQAQSEVKREDVPKTSLKTRILLLSISYTIE